MDGSTERYLRYGIPTVEKSSLHKQSGRVGAFKLVFSVKEDNDFKRFCQDTHTTPGLPSGSRERASDHSLGLFHSSGRGANFVLRRDVLNLEIERPSCYFALV